MRATTIFVFLCFGCAIISVKAFIEDIYIKIADDWWNDECYLKFNSPSGNTFFIEYHRGLICMQTFLVSLNINLIKNTILVHGVSNSPKGIKDENNTSFISFVSAYILYDIYFENFVHPRVGEFYVARLKQTYNMQIVFDNLFFLEKTNINFTIGYSFIRYRLDSFVGPNKKTYKVTYNDGVEPIITLSGNTQSYKMKLKEK